MKGINPITISYMRILTKRKVETYEFLLKFMNNLYNQEKVEKSCVTSNLQGIPTVDCLL